jgi:hypothetical protein
MTKIKTVVLFGEVSTDNGAIGIFIHYWEESELENYFGNYLLQKLNIYLLYNITFYSYPYLQEK